VHPNDNFIRIRRESAASNEKSNHKDDPHNSTRSKNSVSWFTKNGFVQNGSRKNNQGGSTFVDTTLRADGTCKREIRKKVYNPFGRPDRHDLTVQWTTSDKPGYGHYLGHPHITTTDGEAVLAARDNTQSIPASKNPLGHLNIPFWEKTGMLRTKKDSPFQLLPISPEFLPSLYPNKP
jgi:hypothetical protein